MVVILLLWVFVGTSPRDLDSKGQFGALKTEQTRETKRLNPKAPTTSEVDPPNKKNGPGPHLGTEPTSQPSPASTASEAHHHYPAPKSQVPLPIPYMPGKSPNPASPNPSSFDFRSARLAPRNAQGRERPRAPAGFYGYEPPGGSAGLWRQVWIQDRPKRKQLVLELEVQGQTQKSL